MKGKRKDWVVKFWVFIFWIFMFTYHGFWKITEVFLSMQNTHNFCHLSIQCFFWKVLFFSGSTDECLFMENSGVHFTDSNAKIWFHKGISSNMISNFLNPILFRICIEKFNHQMHILIRISAQKLPRRRLEGGGATVFYVVVSVQDLNIRLDIPHD